MWFVHIRRKIFPDFFRAGFPESKFLERLFFGKNFWIFLVLGKKIPDHLLSYNYSFSGFLPKGAFLEKPEKHPDSIGGLNGIIPVNGVHSGVFMIWVDFPFGEGWWRKAGVGKKGPPKRNTGLRGALYTAQFKGTLAIGGCIKARFPSGTGFYYDDGRGVAILRPLIVDNKLNAVTFRLFDLCWTLDLIQGIRFF